MKQFVSFDVYKETLRRLKIPGILFTALNLMVTLIVVGANLAEQMVYSGASPEVIILSPQFVNLFSLVIAFVGAPTYVLIALGWMNRRNESDYYHSLPFTRSALLASCMAAALSWAFLGALLSAAAAALCSLFFHSYLIVTTASLCTYTMAVLATILFMTALFVVGMSITGTYFTNLVISLGILVVPYLLLRMIIGFSAGCLPIINEKYTLGFFSEHLPIPYAWMQHCMYWMGLLNEDVTPMFSWDYIGCTFLYALVLLVVGFVLFQKRKSETAEKGAPNKRLQAVYRVVLSLPFCFFALACFAVSVYCYGEIDSNDVFLCGGIFFLGLVVYFLYELFTTKKWKNLLKALPGLGILFLVNAALLALTLGVVFYHGSVTPDPSDVVSFSLESDVDPENIYSLQSYCAYSSGDIRITDEKAIAVLTEALKENVAVLKQGINQYSGTYYAYRYVDGTYERIYYSQSITLYTKTGRAIHRTISLTGEQYDTVVAALEDSVAYQEIWTKLPAAISGTVRVGNIDNQPTETEKETLLLLMEEEIGENFTAWYQRLSGYNYLAEYSGYGYVLYRVDLNGSSNQITVPIYSDITPLTYAYLQELRYKYADAHLEDVLTALDSFESGNHVGYTQLTVTLYSEGEETLYGFVDYSYSTYQDGAGNAQWISYLKSFLEKYGEDQVLESDASYVSFYWAASSYDENYNYIGEIHYSVDIPIAALTREEFLATDLGTYLEEQDYLY